MQTPDRDRRSRHLGATVLAAAVLAVTVALAPAALASPPGARSHDVLAHPVRWFIDPDSNAFNQAAAWLPTRPADAAQLLKIAFRSQADWFTGGPGDIRAQVAGRIAQIRRQRALPVLVAYNVPGRDCSGFSTGGANTADEYKAWVDGFARGIGGHEAAVILEPDSLALTECLASAQADERYELIRWALQRLELQPRVAVYLDGGHSAWHPAADQAARLARADVGHAQGFFLNVSNYRSNSELLAYGHAVSDAIGAGGGTHFVIDTSRNGRGPWLPPAGVYSDPQDWCNPPGRALGDPATTHTGDPLLDAKLWVKRPGESDGQCTRGTPGPQDPEYGSVDPPAGQWWPEYALGLAQRAPR